jgi:hypothetical protein
MWDQRKKINSHRGDEYDQCTLYACMEIPYFAPLIQTNLNRVESFGDLYVLHSALLETAKEIIKVVALNSFYEKFSCSKA